jgi:hypothetical protein
LPPVLIVFADVSIVIATGKEAVKLFERMSVLPVLPERGFGMLGSLQSLNPLVL